MSKAAMQAAYQEACNLKVQAGNILAAHENQDVPEEKAAEVDRLFDAAEAKIAVAQRYERLLQIGDQLDEPVNRLPTPGVPQGDSDAEAKALYMQALRKALVRGFDRLTDAEAKAMSITSDIDGGFLLAPMEMSREVIQRLDDMVYVRQYATRYQVETSSSLGFVTLDTDPTDPAWTTEIETITPTDAARLGKRELNPQGLAKAVTISEPLLRQSRNRAEVLVQQRLAQVFAEVQETAFLTGTGDKSPLGIFTASSQGIPTSRDTTAASANALAADDFINVRYALKPQYMRNARWILHRNVAKAVRKLKDANGQYLWERGIASDRPDTILDLPYLMSEFAPSSITTGNYVALLGDLQYYYIADSLQLRIQVLVEKYALENKIGYIARMETDGMPALTEAFARLKMA